MDDLLPIHKAVLDTGDKWAARFVEQRKAALDKRGLVASGNLQQQIGYGTEDNAANLRCAVLMSFPGYGRIADMRSVSQDKWGRNAISRVEDWIKNKGVEKFLPGFMAKYGYQTPPKDAILRMAWGVLVNRAAGKFKRKKWYNAAKTAAVNDLYNDIAVATADSALEVVKNSFDFKRYAQVRGRQ